MRQIINGKRYDTETATEIASYSFGNPGDFERCEETLYVTKKGVFFVAGSGGAMSAYAKKISSNTTGGGEGIRVLSEERALGFYAEHGDGDEHDHLFKDLIEEG